DGDRVVIATMEDWISLRKVATGEELAKTKPTKPASSSQHSGQNSVAWASDGSHILFTTKYFGIFRWGLKEEPVWLPGMHTLDRVAGLAISGDGEKLLLGEKFATRLVHYPRLDLNAKFPVGHNLRVAPLAISQDG